MRARSPEKKRTLEMLTSEGEFGWSKERVEQADPQVLPKERTVVLVNSAEQEKGRLDSKGQEVTLGRRPMEEEEKVQSENDEPNEVLPKAEKEEKIVRRIVVPPTVQFQIF